MCTREYAVLRYSWQQWVPHQSVCLCCVNQQRFQTALSTSFGAHVGWSNWETHNVGFPTVQTRSRRCLVRYGRSGDKPFLAPPVPLPLHSSPSRRAHAHLMSSAAATASPEGLLLCYIFLSLTWSPDEQVVERREPAAGTLSATHSQQILLLAGQLATRQQMHSEALARAIAREYK